MAGDTVTTIFGGDDSAFQAAARKVKESMSALAGFANPMRFFKAAQEGAEGLHKSTELAKAGVQSLESALAPLIAMGAALVGVGTVFEGIRRSIELAAKVETAEFHLGAVAGGADKAAASIQRLHEIGDETATGFSKLAEGSIKLQEAGQSADEAAESMGRLQKIALNSGSDIEELGSIYARVLTKTDVSSKDLVKLAMTGIPGIKAISAEFKTLEHNTAAENLAIDKTIQGLNRLFEQQEKQIGSADAFGTKIGLMQASFAAWAMAGGKAIGGLIKSMDGVSEKGIGKMAGTFGAEFTEGLQQIEKETGLSGAALRTFMEEGKMGYDELIAAAGRFREEEHKAADAKLEAEKLQNQNDLLVKQRGLLDEVRTAIETATKPGGIFGSVEKFFETFNGKWEQVQHAIDGMFKNFGDPLINALKPALDNLTAFFQGPGKAAAVEWGGNLGGLINDAMKGLTTGNWGPLEKDGITAFTAILKVAEKGFEDLGVALRDVFSGSETLGALTAFGVVLKDVLSIAVDSIFKKLTTIHIGMSEADIAKFDKEQEAKDAANPTPSASMAKLADDISTLVTKAGALGSKVGGDVDRQNEGKPAGMDQTTWDTFYKPLTPRAGFKPAGATSSAAGTPAAGTEPGSPLTTAAATTATATTSSLDVLKDIRNAQAAPGSGFGAFQVPSAPGKKTPGGSFGAITVNRNDPGSVKTPLGEMSEMRPAPAAGPEAGIYTGGDSLKPADYSPYIEKWPIAGADASAMDRERPGSSSLSSTVSYNNGISSVIPAPAAGSASAAGAIGSTSVTPAGAPGAGPQAAMEQAVAAVVAKLDALLQALTKESGMLEKVLS